LAGDCAASRSAPPGPCRERVVAATWPFRGDAVATAKKNLMPGGVLDGEGGVAVWANAIPANRSLALGALPIRLPGNVRVKRAAARDTIVSFDDVEMKDNLDVVTLRREMEGTAREAVAA
jgi:predicted homoserine dehydrogenase-like protein